MTFINNILLKSSYKNSLPSFVRIERNPKISMSFFTGLDIGIPLNIFQNIFTNLHYGYDITTIKSVTIQFLIGYYTYTKDRYNDASTFIENPYNVSLKKEELYNFINENSDFFKTTIPLSYAIFAYLLLYDTTTIAQFGLRTPFLPFLSLNGEYQSYKKYLGEFKPLYIALMWTIATVIMPCVLYDNNYNILYYPIDYLPCFLTLFATSNIADNRDIDEDREMQINTLPVKYGIKYSNALSIFALLLSSYLLIENPNYDNRFIINSIVEVQNIALIGLLFKSTFSI